jgi:hypothetical protein
MTAAQSLKYLIDRLISLQEQFPSMTRHLLSKFLRLSQIIWKLQPICDSQVGRCHNLHFVKVNFCLSPLVELHAARFSTTFHWFCIAVYLFCHLSKKNLSLGEKLRIFKAK